MTHRTEALRSSLSRAAVATVVFAVACAEAPPPRPTTIPVEQGLIQVRATDAEGITSYLGIPYAAPPVGELRWRPPQPPLAWEGERSADRFGDRCIQTNPFPDMLFQSPEESEDCLMLNIWTPGAAGDRLPVMVWIHGGGFFSGASDEQRHDATALAGHGVVVVTINYRLGALGFLAHPELSAESDVSASGNYGILDQIAALRWVRDNIAAFGGDPGNVTIFGESAGSFSVSTLMASPLARGLFHKAIGESGAARGEQLLAEAEEVGVRFAAAAGVEGLEELRAVPPEGLVEAAGSVRVRSMPNVDGHVLTEPVLEAMGGGRQADVPLLAGWNSAETPLPRTAADQLEGMLEGTFPDDLEAAREAYPSSTEEEAWRSAVALRSDLFIGYSTWKWIEAHASTAESPTFRYLFNQVRPTADGPAVDAPGARHASDIEYVFGTLESLDVAWSEADRRVSEMMMEAWTTFAATGRPSAEGLPGWEAFQPGGEGRFMRLDASPGMEPEAHRARYELLDRVLSGR